MTLYITEKKPAVVQDSMPCVRYSVIANYDDELFNEYADNWLADFASRKDAEAFKTLKEKEWW